MTRLMLAGWCVVIATVPVFAQPAAPSTGYDLIPSVQPVNHEAPSYGARPFAQQMPQGRPYAAAAGYDPLAAQPPANHNQPDPYNTLTALPQGMTQSLPQGSYPSPYYVDGPGCCGPLGRDGRIGYELYSYTGVNLPFGTGLPDYMNAGWTVGGGARTLFFTPTHTAAWTIDFGISYTHNWAAMQDDPVNLFLRSPPITNPFTGETSEQPDRFVFTAIREVHRTSFNYNFGRDVWLWGSGNTGGCNGPNVRVGAWIGGRYGTSRVDLVPLDEVDGYSRRQNAFLGIVGGVHATYEIPVGGWILFGGVRSEYGYDWTNLVPPLQGNIHNVNFQITAGIRY